MLSRLGSVFVLTLALATSTACERSKKDAANQPDKTDEAAPTKTPDTSIETVAVADGITMLVGRGGNVGVFVGDDGVLLIDVKFEDLAEPIREAVGKLSKRKIIYVLNTHHHGDHTGGNAKFGKDATIIAHKNARKNLVANDKAAEALPVITFSEEMSIHFNGQELRLVHLPGGHTDGDAAVYFTKSNVVHLGDNFFNGKLPFIDINSGGSPTALLASTTKLIAELPDDVKLIPGHGPLATKDDLKKFQKMLVDSIDTISAAKKGGASLESVKKKAFGGKYKEWASSFVPEERWAEILYNSL